MERKFYALRDGEIAALHFGDQSQPVRVLFLHANGFNARSYSQILGALGCHVIALDMRGHGRSRLPYSPETLANWDIFRDDAAEFAQRHIEGNFLIAGHSFGAVSSILAAPKLKPRLTGYVGFDPVCIPRSLQILSRYKFWREGMKRRLPIARAAGHRRAEFASMDAAFARYQGRGAFRGVPDAIIRDYLADGLTAQDDGTMRLSCDPKWEQAIFAAQNHNPYKAAKALPANSHIIFAGKYGAVSSPSTRLRMRRAQPKASIQFNKKLAHLFPLQDPDLAAEILKTALRN